MVPAAPGGRCPQPCPTGVGGKRAGGAGWQGMDAPGVSGCPWSAAKGEVRFLKVEVQGSYLRNKRRCWFRCRGAERRGTELPGCMQQSRGVFPSFRKQKPKPERSRASPGSRQQRCSPPPEPARFCAGPGGGRRAAGACSPGGRRVLVCFPFFFPLCLSLAAFSQHQPPAAIPPHPARSRSSSGASCEPGRQRLEPAPPPPSSGGGRRSHCPPPSAPACWQSPAPSSAPPVPARQSRPEPPGGRCQAPPALTSHLKGSAAAGGLQRGFPALSGCWHCGGAPRSELPAVPSLFQTGLARLLG